MGDQLKQKMISAVAWSTIEKIGQQALLFLAGLVFARLLMPADFGVMGIIMIFVTISLILVESGFGSALIRKKEVTDSDYTSVFYFNLLTAFVLYLFLFFAAPYIASFFRMTQLTPFIRVMSLAIPVNSLYLIPYAQLARAMNFKAISTINIIAITVGSVAGIVVAFQDAGVWSLVVQQSSFHLLKMILFQLYVQWKPSGKFKLSVIRELWNYSLKILFTSLLNALFNNLFIIILGRWYSKAEAGQFSQGNKLSETFSYTFQAIFAGSTFALFAQLQNDLPRFGRILGEMNRRTALLTIPVMCFFIAVASPLIILIWTPKFEPAVVYFQLMSLASIFAPFYMMNINALNALGKSGKTMTLEILKKAMIVTGIVVLYKSGIVYMLLAFVAGSLAAFPISVWFVKQELKVPFFRQLGNVFPGILVGVVIGMSAYLLNAISASVWITLGVQTAVAAILYLVIIRVFFRTLFDKALHSLSKQLRR